MVESRPYPDHHTQSGVGPRIDDLTRLEDAGIFMLVLEAVPAAVAREVTGAVGVPMIGIGAGSECDGQVQVFHDLFALRGNPTGPWARSYVEAGRQLRDAVAQYAAEVRSGAFEPPAEP